MDSIISLALSFQLIKFAVYDFLAPENEGTNFDKNLMFYRFLSMPLFSGWTWFSACDFQFFLIMAGIIYLAFRRPIIGIAVVCALVGICIIITFALSMAYDLPPGATAGFFHNELYKNYKNTWQFYKIIYNKPYTRFASYGCGVVLGIVIFSYPQAERNLPRVAAVCLWFLAILLQMLCLFCDFGLFSGMFPGTGGAAAFNALLPFTWSMTIFWIIWACCQNYGGPANTFLSIYFWKPLGRQAFMIYLINCLVIQFYYTTNEGDFHLTNWSLFVFFIGNLALSHLIAMLFTFLFDFPFGRLDEMVTNYLDKQAIEEQERDKEREGEDEDEAPAGTGDEGTEGPRRRTRPTEGSPTPTEERA